MESVQQEFAKAVKKGDAPRVQQLIAAGANVGAPDADGKTALTQAAANGDIQTAKVLIDAGADVNATGTTSDEILAEGMRQIGEDAAKGKPSLFTRLMLRLPRLLTMPLAWLKGAWFVVKNIRHTAHRSEATRTPLMCAVEHGHVDMARFLLDAGANVNATALWNLTDGCTALMFAADQGNAELTALLLERGAHVNAADETEQNALMRAAAAGNAATVACLAAHGAALDARDMDGATALMFAAFNGHADIVQLLLDKGADIHATDSEDDTALNYAESNKHRAIAAMLRAAGARG